MCCKSLRSRVGRFALALLAGLVGLVVLSRTADAAVVEGDRVTFSWQAASGPVVGYDVFVIRNGTATTGTPEVSVSAPTVTVVGAIDDTIRVTVSAFDAAGNTGPLSPLSETVLLTAPAPTTAPPAVVIVAEGDLGVEAALASAAVGEQVIVRMQGTSKQLLDTSIPQGGDPGAGLWGLDQLVVGAPGAPATVRLVDVLALDQLLSPLTATAELTLFGLGTGPECGRDGESGLIIHPGSRLVLGGIALQVFDGQSCISVNDLFAQAGNPGEIAWDAGTIALHGDLEDDGVIDPEDNCLIVPNPNQCDGDRDGFGNACDYDVEGDGMVDVSDMDAVLSAAASSSTDPVYDMNCDGAAGLDDISLMFSRLQQAVGPSGLACAADASCSVP